MVRALAALVVIVMALAGCSRSRGLSDQVSLGGTGGTGGTQNTGAFAGNGQAGITGGGNPATGVAASGAGAGGQGSRPIGVAGTAGGAAPPPPTVTPPPPPPPDNGRAGRDGRGSGGRGGGDANIAGTGGRSDSGPSVGGMILNPNGCHSERPFVLSIAPSGDRGTVSGWLESTPQLAFENELPRFDPTPGGDLAVWWSIGSVDQGMGASLYFYGENDATRVAVAVGARDFDEIDSSRLTFDDWVTPAVMPGTIVVFENTETGERVAMRADKVLDTDPNVSLSGTCAALEASYSFDF